MSQSTFEVLRASTSWQGFWTGTVIMLAFFLEPVVRAAGPSGGQIMHGLMEGRKLGICLMLAGWATILAGAAVFWRTSAISTVIGCRPILERPIRLAPWPRLRQHWWAPLSARRPRDNLRR